jgi:hypothetical protein
MPTPLTPSSSQEIIPISPPPYTDRKGKRKAVDEAATALPRPKGFEPAPDLQRRIGETLKQQRKQEDGQYGKRKARSSEVENERQATEGMSRSRQTERMVGTYLLQWLLAQTVYTQYPDGVAIAGNKRQGRQSYHEL